MTRSIGIDTSNYTTSAASYDGDVAVNSKMLLPVPNGKKGLRQSDVVFHHVRRIEKVMAPILSSEFSAIGVSTRPREAANSYMPCFTVGETVADILGKSHNVPVYKFSHQQGHISAALYSSGALELLEEEFIAFHISGGTTEAVLVKPNERSIISTELIAESTDLKAGQLIDRVGVMLGMNFPCGPELEKLSENFSDDITFKASIKDKNPSISGIENKCKNMIEKDEERAKIAKFAITAICETLDSMCGAVVKEHVGLPILFSGGVCSNKMIKNRLSKKYGAMFAKPEFSSDNASGVAILASIAKERA